MENAIKLFTAIGIAAGMIATVLIEYQNLSSGKKSVGDFLTNPKNLGRSGKDKTVD